MSEQQSLFDGEAYARHTDPDTSKQAANETRGERAQRLQLICMRELFRCTATTHEIADRSGQGWGSVSPRMKQLEIKGFVEKTGEKRPSQYGSACNVYRLTESGRLFVLSSGK